MKACAVIVFAKAPQPGQAKTRLIPALGASGAARLAERLLLNALEQMHEAGTAPWQVWDPSRSATDKSVAAVA